MSWSCFIDLWKAFEAQTPRPKSCGWILTPATSKEVSPKRVLKRKVNHKNCHWDHQNHQHSSSYVVPRTSNVHLHPLAMRIDWDWSNSSYPGLQAKLVFQRIQISGCCTATPELVQCNSKRLHPSRNYGSGPLGKEYLIRSSNQFNNSITYYRNTRAVAMSQNVTSSAQVGAGMRSKPPQRRYWHGLTWSCSTAAHMLRLKRTGSHSILQRGGQDRFVGNSLLDTTHTHTHNRSVQNAVPLGKDLTNERSSQL